MKRTTRNKMLIGLSFFTIAATVITPTAIVFSLNKSTNSNNNIELLENKKENGLETSHPEANQIPSNQEIIPTSGISLFSLEKNRNLSGKDYVLNVNNNYIGVGEIILLDKEGNEYKTAMPVNENDDVYVRVDLKDEYKETHTLTRLWVYSASENLRLGTKVAENSEYYHFQLPPKKIQSPMSNGLVDNPFYNKEGTILVKPFFNVKEVNGWKYDFNIKAYKYVVTEKDIDPELNGIYITNSKNYKPNEIKLNLDLKFVGEYEKNADGSDKVNEYGNKVVVANTDYVLDLNGYDVYFSDFLIPSGVNFALMNSKWNDWTQTGKSVRMYGSRRVKKMSIDLHGVFTRNWGIEEMRLGNPNIVIEQDNYFVEGYPGDGIDHGIGSNRNEHK